MKIYFLVLTFIQPNRMAQVNVLNWRNHRPISVIGLWTKQFEKKTALFYKNINLWFPNIEEKMVPFKRQTY